MSLARFLTASFVPASPQVALLFLRLWLGGSMAWFYGFPKLLDFQASLTEFKKFGPVLGLCAILTESIAALSLAVGFGTRWAALFSAIAMSVAFFVVRHADMSLPIRGSTGWVAFLYFGGFVTLLVSGGGRYSVDALLTKEAA